MTAYVFRSRPLLKYQAVNLNVTVFPLKCVRSYFSTLAKFTILPPARVNLLSCLVERHANRGVDFNTIVSQFLFSSSCGLVNGGLVAWTSKTSTSD